MGMMTFASCSKEKECTCTSIVDGVEMGTTTAKTKEKCSDLSTASEFMGIKTELKCK